MKRRNLLALGAGIPLAAAGAWFGRALIEGDDPPLPQAPQFSLADDPRFAEHGIGGDDAPLRVVCFFDLTCTHCASFHTEVLPQVREAFVDTGRIRLVWTLFPLNRAGLRAAAIAMTAPPGQFEPVVSRLFAAQRRWSQNLSDQEAALAEAAGLSRQEVADIIADEPLLRGILERQQWANQALGVVGTPSFLFGRHLEPGSLSFAYFRGQVERAERRLARAGGATRA